MTRDEANSPLLTTRLLKALRPIGIGAASVSLLQPIGEQAVLLRAEHELPAGMIEVVRKMVSRAAGPDVTVTVLKEDTPMPDKGLVVSCGAYRLALVPARFGPAPVISTTKEAMRGSAWANAHLASRVFKAGAPPTIPFRVLKFTSPIPRLARRDAWQRIVTGVILEPEVVDGTRTEESEGDIYSDSEITGAMYYWMENSFGSYAHHHVQQGGRPLTARDVVLLENWQLREPGQFGDQLVKAGAWMQTNRVAETEKGEQLWADILAGKINSWSIGAHAMGMLEESDAPDAVVSPA